MVRSIEKHGIYGTLLYVRIKQPLKLVAERQPYSVLQQGVIFYAGMWRVLYILFVGNMHRVDTDDSRVHHEGIVI